MQSLLSASGLFVSYSLPGLCSQGFLLPSGMTARVVSSEVAGRSNDHNHEGSVFFQRNEERASVD